MQNRMRAGLIAAVTVGMMASAGAASLSQLELIQGRWRISDKSYCPNECAMSDAETKAFSGRILEYSATRMSNGKTICLTPKYALRQISAQDFYTEFRTRLTDIGIRGNSAQMVEVQCTDAGNVGLDIGDLVILQNRSAIILLKEGVFFLARRK